MIFTSSRLKAWVAGVFATAYLAATARAADFTTEKWRVAEIPLTSAVTYADPFQNVDVTATFIGPGGETIVRPAFWDGGSTWKVRFAPTAVGQWNMTTTCTDAANAGLQGVARTVQCDAYSGSKAIFQHGFLKASADGHYFTYADGTPFFYLGDTHWLVIHERFSTSNVGGVPSQFKYTVDRRAHQGFTVFQSEAIHNPHGSGTHTDPSEEAHADLRDGMTEADLPGFANIDRKFAYIADQGLVHANSMITWALEPAQNAVFTEAYMARLGRYWAARYGAYPVLWTVAQEIDPNMYGAYNSSTMGLWYTGANAVTANDAYAQPLGAHMQSIINGINHPSESSWGGKPYHKWWPMQMQYDLPAAGWEAAAREFYQNVPAKPVVLYESPYDTFWTDNKGARTSGYRAFQTGMYGYGYGSNGTWNDLYTVGDYGTDYYMPASYLKWYDGANLPTGDQMTYMRNFYTALNWWKLIPRYTDGAWSAFSDPDHSLVSSDGNSNYVAYFFGDGNGTGTLKGMAAGAAYEVSWFNPRTGVFTSLGGITPGSAGEWTIPARPTADDWVLLAKQNATALVTTPSNGATLSSSPAGSLSQLAWSAAGASAGLSYEVWLGTAAMYDPDQPHGHLARLTPQGGTASQSVALPTSLLPGTYYWVLAETDPATGTTRSYTSSFTFLGAGITVDNGSFETPGVLSGSSGWAHLSAGWTPGTNNEYQQNNLAPATSAHFTSISPGGGSWYLLLNSNTGSLRKDLPATVNAGDTLSVTFYGGRAVTGSSTAAGGVFTATLMVGATPYSMQVNTATQANNTWQSYTLTRTVTNSGNLSLVFSTVSGDPWLDNIGNVAVTSAPMLFVKMAEPVDGGQFLTGTPVTASATVSDGTGPSTVSYEITGPDGVTKAAGSSSAAPAYQVNLGILAAGTYQIRATATDSAASPATATSLIQTFKVGPTTMLTVENGGFENPGTASGSWAHLAPVWNPAAASLYQQNNTSDFAAAHMSAGSSPGGSWFALVNGNTGSLRQDLHATVNAGDTLAVTFYGGRARPVASTSAGGVFNATFVVGATRYSMAVDTTLLPTDTWQSYTLTKTLTNTGNLSLEFSAVSGDPWLDNISNVVVMPASPFASWLAATAGIPAGQNGFGDDPNHDGVSNGLAWLLGATTALGDSHGLLPAATTNPSGTLILSFDCLKSADRGPATLEVQYGNAPGPWISAAVPDSSGTVNGVAFTITGSGPLHVTAAIPKIDPAGVRLFGRLSAGMP